MGVYILQKMIFKAVITKCTFIPGRGGTSLIPTSFVSETKRKMMKRTVVILRDSIVVLVNGMCPGIQNTLQCSKILE
jgi:hypothetical protein